MDLDREWLAGKLGVSKRTVDNWLSAGAPIPELKLALIRGLMATEKLALTKQNLVIHPTREQFANWTKAFKHSEHETLEEWAAAGLDELADEHETMTPGKELQAVADEANPQSPKKVRSVRYPKG